MRSKIQGFQFLQNKCILVFRLLEEYNIRGKFLLSVRSLRTVLGFPSPQQFKLRTPKEGWVPALENPKIEQRSFDLQLVVSGEHLERYLVLTQEGEAEAQERG